MRNFTLINSKGVGAALCACTSKCVSAHRCGRPLTKGFPNSGAPAYPACGRQAAGRHRGAKQLKINFKIFLGRGGPLRPPNQNGSPCLPARQARRGSPTGNGGNYFLQNDKGISVLFLVIAMLLMVTIGYVFSYLIPAKQKSVIFPIQSNQAFFIAQSGVEFAVRYATDQGWTTSAQLLGLNGGTVYQRNLGAGRFTINYTDTTDTLTSFGEIPSGTGKRKIVVSNFTSFLVSQGQITYFGSASNPTTDPGILSSTTVAVTPPGPMLAGDLVVLVAQSRALGDTLTISQAGGQTWTTENTIISGNNQTLRLFWCRFNGTWSADPSVQGYTTGGVTSSTLVMHVFRPTSGSNTWAIDVAQSGSLFNPLDPYDVTITGITTQTNGALVLAVWGSRDTNIWTLQTSGWSNAGGAQYRNNAGSDQSQSSAYKVQATAGGTGDVTNRQTSLGPDAGGWLIIAFKEVI